MALTGRSLAIVGIACGFAIGVVAALMRVAGGELLIPTIVLLFGADIKLAGSLSLAVSLPTMIVGFTRYSRLVVEKACGHLDGSAAAFYQHWGKEKLSL